MIDLDISAAAMRKALKVVRAVVMAGGCITFVDTRKNDEALVRRTAVACGEKFVTKRWIGGTLTNAETTLGTIKMPDLIIMIGLPVLSVRTALPAQRRRWPSVCAGIAVRHVVLSREHRSRARLLSASASLPPVSGKAYRAKIVSPRAY